MNETVHGHWHFASPIYEAVLDDCRPRLPALAARALALRAASPGVRRSNQGGWHSADDLARGDDPDVRALLERIVAVAGACINDYREQRGAERVGVALTSAWLNVNEAGDWNAPHQHQPADWSGVFYVAVDQTAADGSQDGNILFIAPQAVNERLGQSPTLAYRPRNALLLLFPSGLLHMVAPHRGPEPRISLSFNLRMALTADERAALERAGG